uniref:Uncharacterized protein n=1 Tax=Arundo donax TaxID=35708 RepID=A0A0A9AH37_ARUDO
MNLFCTYRLSHILYTKHWHSLTNCAQNLRSLTSNLNMRYKTEQREYCY